MEEAERLRQEYEDAERLKREQIVQERERHASEQEEAKRLQQKWEEVSRQFCEQVENERRQPKPEQAGDADSPTSSTSLNIPRCTWLAFRDGDGEEVVLARLAVYNREQNEYIFVDRHGIKTRQLSGKELMIIMTRGLMDILEARSRFKDEVTLAQKQAEEQHPCE